MTDVDQSAGYCIMKGTGARGLEQEVHAGAMKIGSIVVNDSEGDELGSSYILFDSKGRTITDEYTSFILKFGQICNEQTMYEMSIEVLENFLSEMEHFTDGQRQRINEFLTASRELYRANSASIRQKENAIENSTASCVGGRKLYAQGSEMFNFLLNRLTGMSAGTHDFKDLQYANCKDGKITNYSGTNAGSSGLEHGHRTSYYGARCTSVHSCPFCSGTGTITIRMSKRDQEKQKALLALRKYFDEWSKSHTDYEDMKARVEQAFLSYKY